jgi:dienelactone hydrolase
MWDTAREPIFGRRRRTPGGGSVLKSFYPKSVLALILLTAQFSTAQGLPPGVTERQVKIGTGEWAVNATLTVPAGKGPFPAVLLVQGSGMGDRDMTIGRNKILRDVANGFAERGIIVLRAEKRLAQHVDQFRAQHIMPNLRTEFIEDSVTAVHLLQQMPEVDRKRVYVFGHSQGATFAPQIARLAGNTAGVVIACGSTRKPGEMMQDQASHVLAQPNISQEDRKEALRVLKESEQLEHLPADDNQFVMGMPASYWRYFYDYDAAAEAASLKGRVLAIQNGRDYEVTEKDLAGWKKALDGKPNVTFKFFPDLNHVLQEGTGVSTPDEYEKLGGASQEFIADIAAWLLAK